MSYSESDLKKLAQQNSKELIRIINCSALSIKELSLAIEIIGDEIKDEQLVLPILIRTLKHIHLSVRESTIYSIVSFYNDKQIPKILKDRLEFLSKHDPSALIRELALDLI